MDQRDNFADLQGETKKFYESHGVQLLGMDFPPKIKLLKKLEAKLKQQNFDAGQYFEIMEDLNVDQYVVLARKPIKAFSKVFLIDHCLSFRYNELHDILVKKPPLVDRLNNMLKYWKQKRPLPGENLQKPQLGQEEYDSMDIVDPNTLKIDTNCVTLSLFGNKIEELDLAVGLLKKLPQLKALWLNDNPITDDAHKLQAVRHIIEEDFPNIELFNRNFTKNAGSWSFKYVTNNNIIEKASTIDNKSVRHLNLADRDIFRVSELSKKLAEEFLGLRSLDISQTTINGLEEANALFGVLKENKIKYLTCDLKIEQILWELQQNGKLKEVTTSLKLVNSRDLDRTVVILNLLNCNNKQPNEMTQQIQDIKKQIFHVTGTYRLLSSEKMDEQAVWYVMDELGTAVQHSDHPNVKILPLLYLPNGKLDDDTISYSILWPIRDIASNEPIYRDYLHGIDEIKFRSSRLSVWFDVPFNIFLDAYQQYDENLNKRTQEGLVKLQQNFKSEQTSIHIPILDDHKVKILTDNELLDQYLTLPYVELTRDIDQCDIVFVNACLGDDINHYLNKWINQFPHEASIVAKDNLASTVQNGLGKVQWLQETYNLVTQLPLFLGAYKTKDQLKKDNTWIIKPPNMARSMDMVVTNNLDIIIRLLETGPKLAQKYIQRPLTLRRKKIDFRYVVLLRSLNPLEVFLYKPFFIRTSNIDYTMDEKQSNLSITLFFQSSFTNYENHFTVMNYGHQLTQIHDHEFIKEFEQENKGRQWDEVHEKLKQMVRELFIAVKLVKPEMHAEKCRAVYGMDMMVSLPDFQPKLLEMTFSPDCHRACKYFPQFYNDIIDCLYFGKVNENIESLF